ncbi:MAG: hypothetical protein H6908_03790 [Hyphomicrobiales bacterium]|nr:hypothetical protein [Hyphomicrobiales bacterium]
MALSGYTEVLGTIRGDVTSRSDGTIYYGLNGDDLLLVEGMAGSTDDEPIYVGGKGADAYQFATNSGSNLPVVMIADYGNSSGDVFNADFALSAVTMRTVDSLHLLISGSAGSVMFLYWQEAANQIETFTFSDGSYSYADFVAILPHFAGYDGNVTLASLGYDTAAGIAFYEDAQAIESRAEALNAAYEQTGTEGNDTLAAESAGSIVYGAGGDDRITGSGALNLMEGGAGNDTILSGDGQDTLQGNQGIDYIDGGAGNDELRGGKDADSVYGGLGDDWLNGNIGADFVSGGGGNDTLRGGQNSDSLDGGDGNDLIYGDKGDDTLTGWNGEDTFVFRVGDGNNTITDFQLGIDRLQLQGVTSSDVSISTYDSGGLVEFSDVTIVTNTLITMGHIDFI